MVSLSDSAIAEHLIQALHGSARAWRAALERCLKSCGLTPALWSAMATLAASTEQLSQRQLAGQLGVDGATLVATIDRLEAGGLVARIGSAQDRRVKLVALTEQGSAVADQVLAQTRALRQAIAAGIDAERIVAAAAVLEELQALLEGA